MNLFCFFCLFEFAFCSSVIIETLCVGKSFPLLVFTTKFSSGVFNASLKSVSISVAVLYLSNGSLDIAFIIILFTLIGNVGFIFIGSTGCSCICFNATETGVSASKGTLPVTISYITTPSEYMSDFASVYPPFACSGEK